MQVNILQAKNQLSQLIKYALAGEEVIIANRGVPVVRLVPEDPEVARMPADANFLHWLAANPLPKHAQLTRKRLMPALLKNAAHGAEIWL